MRRWVYAVRGARVAVLTTSAATLASCIAQLSDLRPDDDAGAVQQGQAPRPSPAGRETSSVDTRRGDAGGSSHATNSVHESVTTTLAMSVEDAGADVAVAASSARDASTETAPMPSGAVSSELEQGCLAGTTRTSADAGSCLPCEAGGYCPGGDAPFTACESGAWDDDANAETACSPKVECLPGWYVVSEGDALVNRACDECATGQYSSTLNAARCEQWTQCLGPDSYELVAPSSSSDRGCERCAPLTVSLEHNASACVPLAYQMTAGQVVFEAEHPHVVTNTDSDAWSTLGLAEVSGGECMEIGPDDTSDWTTDPFFNAPRLDYLAQFEAAGTYYVHIRGDAGVSSEGFSDSCYASIDGAVTDWYRFEVVGGTWGWATKPIDVASEGVHLVSILAREDGFRVDKIVVSSSETAPTGNGPDESATALIP